MIADLNGTSRLWLEVRPHVPGTDIKRLMDEKPDAIGLIVPGMNG
jgi:hypothetical protein